MIHKDSFIKGYCSDCKEAKRRKCDGYCEGLKKELERYKSEFTDKRFCKNCENLSVMRYSRKTDISEGYCRASGWERSSDDLCNLDLYSQKKPSV